MPKYKAFLSNPEVQRESFVSRVPGQGKLSFQNQERVKINIQRCWFSDLLFLHKNVLLLLHPLALGNSQQTDDLGLPSICGTSVKSLHCPLSFNNLIDKIAMTIPAQSTLKKLLGTNGKIYVTLLKTHILKMHIILNPQLMLLLSFLFKYVFSPL